MIDDLDTRIIEELEINARQSSEELSKKFGVSPSTIRRRIARLIAQNAIRIVALPDPGIMGEAVWVVIEMTVSKGSSLGVMDTLLQHSNVRFVSRCMGRYNLMAAARFRSVAELQEFLDSLTDIDGITNYETVLLHMPRFA